MPTKLKQNAISDKINKSQDINTSGIIAGSSNYETKEWSFKRVIEEALKNGELSNHFIYLKNTNSFDFIVSPITDHNITYAINVVHWCDDVPYNSPSDIHYIVYELETDKDIRGMSQLCKILNFDYELWVKSMLSSCLSITFPYYNYNNHLLNSSFDSLRYYSRHWNKPSLINTWASSRSGDRIINHFHPSIFHAKAESTLMISPFEAYQDPILLERCVRNRFIYINDCSPSKIARSGFNINRIAKRPTIFSASRAVHLIKTYLDDVTTIYDPFSGYSGRMLGASVCNKFYIGQDINSTTINESNNIIKYYNLHNISVSVADVLYSRGSYQSLFTCPPYDSKEIWLDGDKEIRSDLKAQDWIEICLKNFICDKYLFIVDGHCPKFKEYIVDIIQNKSHWSYNYECVVYITREQRNHLLQNQLKEFVVYENKMIDLLFAYNAVISPRDEDGFSYVCEEKDIWW